MSPSNPKHLHQVAQPIFVAEAYIIYQDQLLMFKRSDQVKSFPGWWALPGGHIDATEDPLAAALREVKEETAVTISPKQIKLKAIAMHHHLDLGKVYIVFSFLARLDKQPKVVSAIQEGQAHWIEVKKARTMTKIFPPLKYYFAHILGSRPGIIYNNSQWKNSQLVKVLSETIDRDY
ncbi:MAG: NUDIX domain-containing protein [Candidatus Pacebacteria bacterium]|nr:NUDIX domain-containing protein [Candidatus Paceibacterota bacterium]